MIIRTRVARDVIRKKRGPDRVAVVKRDFRRRKYDKILSSDGRARVSVEINPTYARARYGRRILKNPANKYARVGDGPNTYAHVVTKPSGVHARNRGWGYLGFFDFDCFRYVFFFILFGRDGGVRRYATQWNKKTNYKRY